MFDLKTTIFVYIPALAVAIAIHECGHATAGYLLGDPTPRDQGRVTLNPFAHLDPIGILLPFVLAVAGSPMMFGWGKPVLIQYENLKKPIRDEALIAAAGPLMNIVLCIVCVLVWHPVYEFIRYGTILGYGGFADSTTANFLFDWAHNFLKFTLNINIGLFLFNLLPLPPLDGSKILFNFFGKTGKAVFYKLQPFGFILLLLVLFSGKLNVILLPPYKFLMNIFIQF